MARCVVTGGAGFIGSHLAEALLARGDQVLVVDDLSTGKEENVPAAAELLLYSIASKRELDLPWEPELVFHLAAQSSVAVSMRDPIRTMKVNVVGTQRVLGWDARMVFASTGGAIYGECGEPATEDKDPLPRSVYGASKLAAEAVVAADSHMYGQGHLSLRFGNVYGPRQDPHGEAGVVAIFLGALREKRPVRIHGDGSQVRDYVFVEDVVKATLLAADSGRRGVLNVGSGVGTSVNELLTLCVEVSGVTPVEVERGPKRLGDLQSSLLSNANARALGWSPEVTLEEGIRRTWDG